VPLLSLSQVRRLTWLPFPSPPRCLVLAFPFSLFLLKIFLSMVIMPFLISYPFHWDLPLHDVSPVRAATTPTERVAAWFSFVGTRHTLRSAP